MTVEAALLKIGSTIANAGGRLLIGSRQRKATREASLAELVGARGLGIIPQRRLERQLEQLSESIAERMSGYVAARYPELPENERIAALEAVGDTLAAADLTDPALMKANASATRLRAMVDQQAQRALAGAGLSEDGESYFKIVLRESVVYLTEVVVSLPSFQGRALRELLDRDSTIIESLREILDRMPSTLESEDRRASDIEIDYLREVARKLDQVEIFGVNSHQSTRRLSLSVAYIGLSVRSDNRKPLRLFGDAEFEVGPTRGEQGVEQVLSLSSRLLIKGEAGSGKTTLLRWLAVNCAQRSLGGRLRHLNDLIPFFVQLRRYSEKDLPSSENLHSGIGWQVLADRPSGWLSSILRDGKGLVLVDGIDEMPEWRRAEVMDWVSDLVACYPECTYIVTSRPPAVSDDWLQDIRLAAEDERLETHVQFRHAELQPMTPNHVQLFIRHWHEAAGLDGTAEEREELEALRGRLVAAIDASMPLRSLATNPLLCALLCALNQDRQSQLPKRRIELYQTALEMLLTRRDMARDVKDPAAATLTTDDKLQVLADVAFWFTENNFVTADRDRVLRQVERSLRTFVGRRLDPVKVYKHLLLRSGILREPTMGKVDFLHKTFQEFLCARKIVESDSIEMLLDRLHKKSFLETIVMAVGLARPHEQDDLMSGLLDEINDTPDADDRTELQMLVIRCLETATRLAGDLYRDALEEIQAVVPPRTVAEARALAMSGTDALRFLPTEDMHSDEVIACIRTAGLIGGPEAFDYISTVAGLYPFVTIGDELVSVWPFFDPVEFGQRVFHNASTSDVTLVVTEPTILPGVARTSFSNIICEFNETARFDDLVTAANLPSIAGIRLENCQQVTELAWLEKSTSLNEFRAISCGALRDISPLGRLPRLLDVRLVDLAATIDYSGLETCRSLRSLKVGPIDQASAAHLLTELAHLRSLELLSCLGLQSVAHLGGHAELRKLKLDGCHSLSRVGNLEGLPRLTELRIQECPLLTSVADLKLGGQCRSLAIHWCDAFDSLAGLESCQEIQELSLVGLRRLTDIQPLAALKSLRRIRIRDCPRLSSLAPLAALPELYLVDAFGLHKRVVKELAATRSDIRISDRAPSAEFLAEDA